MRTLLVTGHTGFVGRTVQSVLAADQDSLRWGVATLPDGFDIRSPALAAQVADVRPDAVLHLAGLTSVGESFREPERYFDVNFNGTWNLLRALRIGQGDPMILFSSPLGNALWVMVILSLLLPWLRSRRKEGVLARSAQAGYES